MRPLEVGKLYQEGLNKIPEGMLFDFNQGGGFLRVVFESPLDNEITQMKQGKIKFGLLEKDGIIFLFLKFGTLAWMDAQYNIELSQPYTLKELTDESKGCAVQIVLIEGMTGIVKALKLIELSHAMSVSLKELIEKQLKNPVFSYDSTLNRISCNYSTENLLKEATIYTL